MALQTLLEKLFGETPELAGQDAASHRLAAAVLLLEIAKSDFELDQRELAAVSKALQTQFNLSSQDVQQLIDQADAEHAAHTSLEPYVRVLNQNSSPAAKRKLLQALWEVAHADGVLHSHEEHMMRRVADMLYLSHADFIQTKLAVVGS